MGAKQRAPLSGEHSSLGSPPFLPLEETMSPSNSVSSLHNSPGGNEDIKSPIFGLKLLSSLRENIALIRSRFPKVNGKKVVMSIMGFFFVIIVYESFFVDPEDRLMQPDFADKFLGWVEDNPGWGLGAIWIVIAAAVVTMIPIGTPLTVGCGYIYRGVYGWKLGLCVATIVSMTGSCLGAVVCFLLGRYLMRDVVQDWVRKYPLFDAINVAAKEQGFKIMAMLYLTPVLPLGLVSYMCGTTSMNISAFTIAKVFSLPLYLIYTFIGASAHSFIKRGGKGGEDASPGLSATEEAKQLEENEYLIVSGLLLSFIMMTLITRHIRKELMKILDKQKKDKPGEKEEEGSESELDDVGLELGRAARRRGNKTDQTD